MTPNDDLVNAIVGPLPVGPPWIANDVDGYSYSFDPYPIDARPPVRAALYAFAKPGLFGAYQPLYIGRADRKDGLPGRLQEQMSRKLVEALALGATTLLVHERSTIGQVRPLDVAERALISAYRPTLNGLGPLESIRAY